MEYVMLALAIGALCTIIGYSAKDHYKVWKINKDNAQMEATRDQWDDPDYKTIQNFKQ